MELAIRAGDEVGCGVVDELTLAAPLVLPASGSVAVQVVVNGPDESGVRGVSVYSRGDVGTGWVLHAEGALRAGSAEPTADLAMWPPAGAVPVEVADGYQQLAERGYGYGPAFRGLTAMWRRGDEVFAEVALPADAGVSVTGFGVHPVLLDAALHAVVLSAESAERGQGSVLVPFSWQGVSLHAAGASAGAGPHRASGSVGGVDRAGRWVGIAGVVSRFHAGPTGDRSAIAGGGVELGSGPAIRGHLVAAAIGRGGAATGVRLGDNGGLGGGGV